MVSPNPGFGRQNLTTSPHGFMNPLGFAVIGPCWNGWPLWVPPTKNTVLVGANSSRDTQSCQLAIFGLFAHIPDGFSLSNLSLGEEAVGNAGGVPSSVTEFCEFVSKLRTQN